MKEYQVFLLDPKCVLAHMGDVLFETDRLELACGFAFDVHGAANVEICVWQPRTEGYREYYKINRS